MERSAENSNSPQTGNTLGGKVRDFWRNMEVGLVVTLFGMFFTFLSVTLFNSIQNRFDSLDQRFDSVTTLIDGNKNAISSLEGRVTVFDGRVAEVQSEIRNGVNSNGEKIADRKNEITEIQAKYDIQSRALELVSKDSTLKSMMASEGIRNVEQSIASLIDEVKNTTAISDKVSDNASLLNALNNEIADTEYKIGKLEIMLELGVDNIEVKQALARLFDRNPELFEDTEKVKSLWNTKEQSSSSEFEVFLTENYEINPKDSYLIAYDDLTIQRPLTYFLQKKELRSVQSSTEPDLGALTPLDAPLENELADSELVETYQVLEEIDLSTERMSIHGVCELLPQTPHTECYLNFLRKIGEIGDDKTSESRIISNAVSKALIQKYSD